jgi:protocatechuate 3,4-dioxygenase beta subunit
MKATTTLGLAMISIAAIVVAAWSLRGPGAATPRAPERGVESVHRPEASFLEAVPTSPAAGSRRATGPTQSAPAVDIASSAELDTAHLHVLVLDRRTDTPLADAFVEALCSEDLNSRFLIAPGSSKSTRHAFTEADGRVDVEVPAGHDLGIRAVIDQNWLGSKFTTLHPLVRGEVRDVTLRVPTDRDLEFWCRFVDDATQVPIANVKVSIVNYAESIVLEATSDENGLVHLAAKDWRKVKYRADAAGRGLVYFCPESGRESVDRCLVVPLAASASLQVRIIDAQRKPVVGMVVEVDANGRDCAWNGFQPAALDSIPYPQWTEITDDDGRVEFHDLPARIALEVNMNAATIVHLREDPRHRRPIFLAPGQQAAFEWTARGACDVSGRVVDSTGTPVVISGVWLMPRSLPDTARFTLYMNPEYSATTDMEGRFEFRQVPTGEWSIGPSALHEVESSSASLFVPAVQNLDITEGMTTTSVEIRLDHGLMLRGQVRDSKGALAPDAMVMVSALDHALLTFAHTEEDGSFAVSGLTAGTFEIAASPDAGCDAGSEVVRVEPGAAGIVLRLREGASISGRVVDANGFGALATLTIGGTDETHFDPERILTDTEGEFRIAQLEPGAYDIAAYHPDGRAGFLRHVQISAEHPAEDLLVQLAVGGRVRVRAEHETGLAKFKLYAGDLLIDTWFAEKGEYHTLSVPAGSALLKFELEDGHVTCERRVDVKVGETIEIGIGKEAR